MYHLKITKRAIGMTEGKRTKIAVSFPTTVFDTIANMAVKNNLGFQEQVRRLCEAGLKRKPHKEGP